MKINLNIPIPFDVIVDVSTVNHNHKQQITMEKEILSTGFLRHLLFQKGKMCFNYLLIYVFKVHIYHLYDIYMIGIL